MANEDIIQCPKCGFGNSIGSLFCGKCGHSLSIKCRRCWASNPLGLSYCSRCGIELAKATFGLPPEIAEQWAARFMAYEWPRQIGQGYAALFSKINPAFDPKREIIIATSGIKGKAWLVGVTVPNHIVYSSDPEKLSGGIVITNWRLIVLDILNNWAGIYLYEHLLAADMTRFNPKNLPIFDLNFGSNGGAIELVRSRMPEVPQPTGTITSMLLYGPYAIDHAMMEVEAGKQIAANIREVASENKMVVDFFQNIIITRQQL